MYLEVGMLGYMVGVCLVLIAVKLFAKVVESIFISTGNYRSFTPSPSLAAFIMITCFRVIELVVCGYNNIVSSYYQIYIQQNRHFSVQFHEFHIHV